MKNCENRRKAFEKKDIYNYIFFLVIGGIVTFFGIRGANILDEFPAMRQLMQIFSNDMKDVKCQQKEQGEKIDKIIRNQDILKIQNDVLTDRINLIYKMHKIPYSKERIEKKIESEFSFYCDSVSEKIRKMFHEN